jgi:hypothetical protein
LTSRWLFGRALLAARISLTCPSCEQEFAIAAGNLIAKSIDCTHCRARVELDHADRLAIWNQHVREVTVPLEVEQRLKAWRHR